MAKRKSQSKKEERVIYCSGPNWEGDGSKDSSPCKFGESMTTSAERFKCSYCAVGLSPNQIHADKNGIRVKEEVFMPSKNAPDIESVDTPQSTEDSPDVDVLQVDDDPSGPSILEVDDEPSSPSVLETEDTQDAAPEPLPPEPPRKKKPAAKKRIRRRF
jgi:hypothetical protein